MRFFPKSHRLVVGAPKRLQVHLYFSKRGLFLKDTTAPKKIMFSAHGCWLIFLQWEQLLATDKCNQSAATSFYCFTLSPDSKFNCWNPISYYDSNLDFKDLQKNTGGKTARRSEKYSEHAELLVPPKNNELCSRNNKNPSAIAPQGHQLNPISFFNSKRES